MRAADGSTKLVSGGPEAERAFAESQLLQQQLITGDAQNKLASARDMASQIASQNIARQQAEQEALRVDAERRARLALDQDAQAEQTRQNRARIQIDAADREQQNQLRLNDQNIARARYAAAAQLDSDKLQQSATQFAKNLALQEKQLEERQRSADFSQKKETDRIAEGLLKQMRSKKLTDEGQKKVAELSSIYRGIASNKSGMRGHQYDSMMQDWLDLAESANIDQYAVEQPSVTDEFKGNFGIADVGGQQYEVFRDADGNLSYERLENAGPTMFRTYEERAARVASDPDAQAYYLEKARESLLARNPENTDPTNSQLMNEIKNLVMRDQLLQNELLNFGQPPVRKQFDEGNLSMGRDASVDMAGLMRAAGNSIEPPSPSDGRQKMKYPSPQDATKLPTWGGAKTDYGSMRKQLFEEGGGFYGTDRSGMKRLTDPAERSFFNAMKAHRSPPSKEHQDRLNEILLNDVESWSSGSDMKKVKDAILKSKNPFKYNERLLINRDILLKMIKAGIKDPLGNAAKGMAEAVATGQDHFGTIGTPHYHRELNAPILPRKSFENLTGEQIGKLPVIWMDEFGMLYQRDESSRPKPEQKSYREQVQGIRN